ncbi:MAG: Crp/Fnr family transcriptional regulator [Clostridia bacterium]|nr:Crp/Fnr family transcriptional regulator [Clostridia bacterium]
MINNAVTLKHGNKLLLNHPQIYQFAKIVKYRKKDIVFREGTIGNHIYILLSGVLMAYRTSENGQQRILQFFRPNDIYGNITLVEDYVHTMTVEVLEPAVNLEINKRYVKQLISQEPEILWYLYEDIAKKLCSTAQMIEDNYLTAEQRIVKSIINLCRQFGYSTKNGIELKVNLTQDELARYAGTTRVTAAKQLSSLVDRGIIRTMPKPWIIYRMDELMNYLQ